MKTIKLGTSVCVVLLTHTPEPTITLMSHVAEQSIIDAALEPGTDWFQYPNDYREELDYILASYDDEVQEQMRLALADLVSDEVVMKVSKDDRGDVWAFVVPRDCLHYTCNPACC